MDDDNSKHKFVPTFSFKRDRSNLNYTVGGSYQYNISQKDNIRSNLEVDGNYNIKRQSNEIKNIRASLGYDHIFNNNAMFNVQAAGNLNPNFPKYPTVGAEVKYTEPNLELYASGEKVINYPAYNYEAGGKFMTDEGFFVEGKVKKEFDKPIERQISGGIDLFKFIKNIF